MKTDLTTATQNNSSTRDLDSSVKNNISDYQRVSLNKKDFDRINRQLHAPKKTKENGFFSGSKQVLEDSIFSSTNVIGTGLSKLKNFAVESYLNPKKRVVISGVLGSFLGLSSFNLLLNMFKKQNKPNATTPAIFNLAKLVTSSSMALAMLASVAGKSFALSPLSLLFGIGILFGLHIISSIYENDNSAFSKIANLLGVKNTIKDLMNFASF